MKETAHERLTIVRREIKYLVEAQQGERLLSRLENRIPLKIVDQGATSYRVTVYLDTPDYHFCRAELRSSVQSVKLRVKDYYVFDGNTPKSAGNYWLEAKVRVGSMVEKSRFAVPKEAISHVLRDGVGDRVSPDEAEAASAFEALRAGRSLSPVFVVHYRRTTLENKELNTRITFDECVTFHNPVEEIFVRHDTITRRDLPPPFKVETKWVIELKANTILPPFIEEILPAEQKVSYSKFNTGVHELERRGLLK